MQIKPTFTCLTIDIKDMEPDYWPLIRNQIDRDTLMAELVTMYKKKPVLKEDRKDKFKKQQSEKNDKRQQSRRRY